MTITPVRPEELVHEEPVTDAAEGTHVRSPGFRLALLVALVAVLLAGLGSLAYLLSTRAVDAVGIVGDQAQVQGDREAVMAQTEQFVLRFGTYGPDLLDEQGGMPAYRQRVKDVITPKFAVSFDKQAGTQWKHRNPTGICALCGQNLSLYADRVLQLWSDPHFGFNHAGTAGCAG